MYLSHFHGWKGSCMTYIGLQKNIQTGKRSQKPFQAFLRFFFLSFRSFITFAKLAALKPDSKKWFDPCTIALSSLNAAKTHSYVFIAVSLILCGLRLNLQSLNLPSGQSNLMRTFIFLYTITMISFHPLFYKALIIHRFPLKKYQETFMTLLFFLYFFRFGHKIYSKVSTKVSSNQSKQFQSKNWYTFLRRKVKNSLSHKINISSSVVSVDISSQMFLFRFYSPAPVVLKSVTCMAAKLQFFPRRLTGYSKTAAEFA